MVVEPTHSTRRARLEHVRVRDCMHNGIVTCPPDAPLGEVAALMARHRIHAVVVAAPGSARPLGIVSDSDIVSAAKTGEELYAREVAATESVVVSADESLRRAAQLMAEHRVSHLVAVDAASGYPRGVLSTLDVAAVYADRAPHAP
jgi:CBS domain-containing protein